MNWFTKAITSTIGQKLVMGLTGLFLVSFLLVHLIGNIQLFFDDGGKAFNEYTKFMTTSPLIRVAEIILVTGFLLHIVMGLALARKNTVAKGPGYKKKAQAPRVSLFSRIMPHTGVVILVFLIIHLINFWGEHKFGELGTDQWGNKDMYDVTVTTFQNLPVLSVFYVLSMMILAFHLNHGFQSAFKTFGLNHGKYTPFIQFVGTLVAILIPAGFASIPIYFMILNA